MTSLAIGRIFASKRLKKLEGKVKKTRNRKREEEKNYLECKM